MRFRLLTDQDYAAIQEAAQKTRHYVDRDTGRMEMETQLNTIADRKEAAVRATLEWENFYDQDRKLMPCTKENVEFWACDLGFSMFLKQCQVELQRIANEQLEAARKN